MHEGMKQRNAIKQRSLEQFNWVPLCLLSP
jgi:hypothetical protein